jgi:hypothetical protein
MRFVISNQNMARKTLSTSFLRAVVRRGGGAKGLAEGERHAVVGPLWILGIDCTRLYLEHLDCVAGLIWSRKSQRTLRLGGAPSPTFLC